MPKKSKPGAAMRRYWRDVRAIAKATGRKPAEARGLYRQARELAGTRKRPARRILVDLTKRSELDVKRHAKSRRKKAPETKETEKAEIALEGVAWWAEAMAQLKNTITVAAPFLNETYDHDDTTRLVADLWRSYKAYTRRQGTKTNADSTWMLQIVFEAEWSPEGDQRRQASLIYLPGNKDE